MFVVTKKQTITAEQTTTKSVVEPLDWDLLSFVHSSPDCRALQAFWSHGTFVAIILIQNSKQTGHL